MESCFTNRVVAAVLSSLYLGVAWVPCAAGGGEAAGDKLSGQLLSGLQRYCFECHSEKRAKKDLRLDQFTTVESVLREEKVWQRVLDHLENREMPPDDADVQLGDKKRGALVAEIDQILNEADWERYRRPGWESVARLTRGEYGNTMRDLLGIDLHSERGFVIDGEGESGFRNERASLAADAAQVEKYLDAAGRAVEGVMALALSPSTAQKTFRAETMERSMPGRMQPNQGGMSLANPGQELSAEFEFPADGYYQVSLRASVMGKPTTATLRVEGKPVAEIPVAGAETNKLVWPGVMFVRKGRHRWAIENKNMFPVRRMLPPNAAEWAVNEGKRNHPRLAAFPGEDPRLRIEREAYNKRSAGVQEAYEWLRMLGVEGDPREIDRFRNYAWQREEGLRKARRRLASLAALEVAELEALWQKQNRERLADNARLLDRVKGIQWADWMAHQGKIFLTSVAIEGPVYVDGKYKVPGEGEYKSNPATLLGLMENWDGSDGGALGLLEDFLPLAFRREVGEKMRSRYINLYQSFRAGKEPADEALRLALTAVLAAPEFLFREEKGEEEGAEKGVEALDAWTMASRLSYFLWSTMPDRELFDLAKSGELADPTVLRQQADRLLDDERAAGFFQSFVGQWLGIDSLGKTVSPDVRHFPEFTPDLAEMMKEETVRYVQTVFVENRPLDELIDSDWTFLNQRLAGHYGVDGVRSFYLNRVEIDDRRRGGLLGMGSVLTVTSSPARTNPMRRGFWVLENLLGDPLGEPPGDAGELPGNAGPARGKTLREEIELHRTKKSCMSCHVKLDPIGFGLQNFDALGRWRDREAGKKVDSAGVMPDGREFDGPVELKTVLLERKDDIVKNLCARVLSYALGRKLEYYDEAEVRRIFAEVKEDGYRARTLVRAVASSYPFRYRDYRDTRE